MKFYALFSLAGIIFHLSECIKIKPELQKNILSFGYGINYKYEGMLVHSFDRFHVFTKFMLPVIGDIKFSRLNFDDTCAYMKRVCSQHRFKKIFNRIKNLLQQN